MQKNLIPSTKTNEETIGNGDLSNYGLKKKIIMNLIDKWYQIRKVFF